MNNMLPSYFEYMKPVQPVACNYYVIRKPRLHPPIINHEFMVGHWCHKSLFYA